MSKKHISGTPTTIEKNIIFLIFGEWVLISGIMIFSSMEL